jgi:hypothetical protein
MTTIKPLPKNLEYMVLLEHVVLGTFTYTASLFAICSVAVR